MGEAVLGRRREEVDDVVGELAGGGELVREVVELGGGGQAAVPEQVSGFFEGGLLRELVDVDAAVGEDAFGAVDETDGGLVGDDVLQALGCGGGHRCSAPENRLRTQYPAIIGQRRMGCHESWPNIDLGRRLAG